MNKMIILVDIDGVLADFEEGFAKEWKKKFPQHSQILFKKRKTFYLADTSPDGLGKEIQSILSSPGFFKNLDIISGGKEALKKMETLGHKVIICTSPISNYKNCVLEKYHWIEKNLGFKWTKRIIMTKDKTLVFGDILIDDKPEHIGLRKSAWKHVLFDAPYNQHVKTKLRITWDNWERILE